MMDALQELHFRPYLERHGFVAEEAEASRQLTELCFHLKPEAGEGFYRLIPFGDQFWISLIDLRLRKDLVMEYPQFEFLSLSYYESAHEDRLDPQTAVESSALLGYASVSGSYRSVIRADIPYRSTSIILLPGYYERRLREQYAEDYESIRDVLKNIAGPLHIPELSSLLIGLKRRLAPGLAAKLHYESIVTRALSLLAEHAQQTAFSTSATIRRSSMEDRRGIERALALIEEHYSDDSLRLDSLARAANMSATKFKKTFKCITGSTLSAYRLSRRMEHARKLLETSELDIAQIAYQVGYRKAGSFSEAFKKYSGVLPNVYRNSVATRP